MMGHKERRRPVMNISQGTAGPELLHGAIAEHSQEMLPLPLGLPKGQIAFTQKA